MLLVPLVLSVAAAARGVEELAPGGPDDDETPRTGKC